MSLTDFVNWPTSLIPHLPKHSTWKERPWGLKLNTTLLGSFRLVDINIDKYQYTSIISELANIRPPHSLHGYENIFLLLDSNFGQT